MCARATAISASAVVPWVGGCEYRQRAWDWLRAAYPLHSPGLRVVEAPGPLPWSKGAAANPAIQNCQPGSIVVVADADVWCEGLQDAITAVQSGAPWAVPHSYVRRLTEESTAAVLDGEPLSEGLELVREVGVASPYLGLIGGGMVVARREQLLEVPLDPRFIGWGQEDECWGMALTCMAGHPWRGDAPLYHLWHPPQPRKNRRAGSKEGMELRRRYAAARRHPEVMQRLLREVTG